VNARCLFIFAALLFLVHAAHAGGGYQRTRDGKTLVWNNQPMPGDAAAWSGERDADGYATGTGTLTWFRRIRPVVTGSHLAGDRYREVSRYSGKMVRGKLEGAIVNVDANGRRFHGTFVDGKKTKDWSVGRGDDRQSTEPASQAEAIEAPAEGPTTTEKSEATQAPPTNAPATEVVSAGAAAQPAAAQPPAEEPANMGDDSLRVLTAPPRTLRLNIPSEAAPETIPQMNSSGTASPRLGATEVIDLADAEARIHGYDLNEYQRSQAQYRLQDETWSVSYGKKSDDAISGKHFSINVEDRTKKTSLAADR
jgi:hypothetical protein